MSDQIERDTILEFEEDEKKRRTGRVLVKEKKLRATVEARDSLRRQKDELKGEIAMLKLTRKKLSDMVDLQDLELKDAEKALAALRISVADLQSALSAAVDRVNDQIRGAREMGDPLVAVQAWNKALLDSALRK